MTSAQSKNGWRPQVPATNESTPFLGATFRFAPLRTKRTEGIMKSLKGELDHKSLVVIGMFVAPLPIFFLLSAIRFCEIFFIFRMVRAERYVGSAFPVIPFMVVL